MKGLIRELGGPRMREGKRFKVSQNATREARYMPESLTLCRRWSTLGLRWYIQGLSGTVADLKWH